MDNGIGSRNKAWYLKKLPKLSKSENCEINATVPDVDVEKVDCYDKDGGVIYNLVYQENEFSDAFLIAIGKASSQHYSLLDKKNDKTEIFIILVSISDDKFFRAKYEIYSEIMKERFNVLCINSNAKEVPCPVVRNG